MIKTNSSFYLLIILLTLTAQGAVARPSILAAWQSAYPASDSDLVNCQLCHQNTSGGNPWNAYGWNIRQGIQNNGLAASASIAAVEAINSDASVVSASNNLEEIVASTQPGWTAGAANTIYFKDGSTLTSQTAPSLVTALDPPETATVPISSAWLALLGLSLAWVGMFRRLNRCIK
jgi:mono/diheme cytochrome c family protein